MGRHANTVRVLGADGEHHCIDAEKAHEFLATLVRCTDRHTGLLTLEAETDQERLTKHERLNLVPSRQFDAEELLATDAPSEDGYRATNDTLFTEDVEKSGIVPAPNCWGAPSSMRRASTLCSGFEARA